MARIFDVIEYPNEMANEIVRRFPEEGYGDFRVGSQVIVRESQTAVFFRDGQALDVFKPGRHTIATANIPKLIDVIGKAFNDRTPFHGKNMPMKNGVLLARSPYPLLVLVWAGCSSKVSVLTLIK